jgi:hypothetical protein
MSQELAQQLVNHPDPSIRERARNRRDEQLFTPNPRELIFGTVVIRSADERIDSEPGGSSLFPEHDAPATQ